MPTEMPEGFPFSVDTWSPSSMRKRHHFLTHAHTDHCKGISHHSSSPIYSTHLTKTLILHQFPHVDDSRFVEIEVGQSVDIDDPDGTFSVSAFDANHCPGDCRLTPDCLRKLPMKYRRGTNSCLDYLYLDCTFASCSLTFPSCHSAIEQIPERTDDWQCHLCHWVLQIGSGLAGVLHTSYIADVDTCRTKTSADALRAPGCTNGSKEIKVTWPHNDVINCIGMHPNAPFVYLACDLLGYEEILVEVSRTFRSKIYVDETKYAKYFQNLTLTAPHILSPDPSTRFQIFKGTPKLYERVTPIVEEARSNLQPEPLFIRPSVQWYVHEEISETEKRGEMRFKEAKRDQFGVWHVCYSSHSSKEELEWALQLLQPKQVISTTTCSAMELDYVENNCFNIEESMIPPDEFSERRSLWTSYPQWVKNDPWLSAEERILLQGPNENDIVVAMKEEDGILWRMFLQKPQDVHQSARDHHLPWYKRQRSRTRYQR